MPTPGIPENLSIFFKLATKQKIMVPTAFLDFMHQMENFKLPLEFNFGIESILYRQFCKLTDHIHHFGTEYEECINNIQNPWFLARYISFVDCRIQLFLESCSINEVSKINYSFLDFDTMLMNIIDGAFSAELPSIIEQALTQEPPQQPSPTNNK